MRTIFHRVTFAAIVLAALIIPLAKMDSSPARADVPLPPPIEGTSRQCEDFAVSIFGPLTDVLLSGVLAPFGISAPELKADVPDEGWVWVNRSDRYREVEGVVERSKTAAVDFPATHDTHDQNTIIKVDPEYTGVLGLLNEPNEEVEEIDRADLLPPTDIEMEWEHGTRNFETGRNEPERFFPRWAWPAAGDRVWTEGNWVFDCGHATKVDGVDHFRSEIHPARAIAAMRQQVHDLPGSGTTQVPVTATDLYIHGRAGIITDILEYGQTIVQSPTLDVVHDINDHLVTPIDTDFDFEVCLPPQPSPGAVAAFSFEDGPGNTISIPPQLEIVNVTSTDDPCAATGPKELHVRVPLAGTGVSGDEVYARKIYAGWVYPPSTLRHFAVKLDRMDLHTDKEVEGSIGGDCECTFFYVNLDKAPNEWSRLADHWVETCNIYIPNPFGDDVCIDHNQLYDYDSDELLGNGLLNFSGPTYDFLVQDGQPFHIRSNGYDQDCADDLFDLPLLYHFWNAINYATCYYLTAAVTFEKGRNDDFARLDVCFVESDESLCNEHSTEHITGYGVGTHDFSADGEYDMRFTVTEEPVDEPAADLAVTKACGQGGEVALAGAPFTCTVTVTNAGPGLPRDVVVADTLSTVPAGATYNMSAPVFRVTSAGETGDEQPCTVGVTGAISCAVGSIPVGGSAAVTFSVTPSRPGLFNDRATVSSTADPNSANDAATASVDVFLPVQLDVLPGSAINPVNLMAGGVMAIAILKTPDFDPAVINYATVCFGDAEAPAQRSCVEVHGKAHFGDVDGDKDRDVTLHYNLRSTGIDPGDTRACLIGRTTAGIGIYACDVIRTQ